VSEKWFPAIRGREITAYKGFEYSMGEMGIKKKKKKVCTSDWDKRSIVLSILAGLPAMTSFRHRAVTGLCSPVEPRRPLQCSRWGGGVPPPRRSHVGSSSRTWSRKIAVYGGYANSSSNFQGELLKTS